MKITRNKYASLADAQEAMKSALDLEIDARRASFSAAGQYITAEYQLTATQAQAFKDAGYQGDVPSCVQSWARAANLTPTEATDNILATRSTYERALEITRDIRLNGKAQISASATAREAETAFNTAIQSLQEAVSSLESQ